MYCRLMNIMLQVNLDCGCAVPYKPMGDELRIFEFGDRGLDVKGR